MRPSSYIALGLALATAVNVTAIIKARAEPANNSKIQSAWLTYVTSGHHGQVQHLITARYDAPDIALAFLSCRSEAKQFILGIGNDRTLQLVVPPTCATEKPAWWID